MHGGMFLILLIFGLPLIIVAGFFLIWALKIITGGSPQQREKDQAEETRLIQELYQGLSRMEERIEALETILLDRERKDSVK